MTSRTASAEREPGRPIVVKLGGSLAESRRLARILQIVAASRVPVVVVPGGGAFADAVRRAQADFGLPDAAAHRMALLAMHQTGLMLAALNGRLEPVETLPAMRAALTRSAIPVWLPYKMASRDPRIPADWSATSDGLAARLAERLEQRAGTLSGGEKKLLSFCRAIADAAPLTLLDEPSEGVQQENLDRMSRFIRQRQSQGAAFVIVEQNLAFLVATMEHALVLDHGECVLSGPAADLPRSALEAHLSV